MTIKKIKIPVFIISFHIGKEEILHTMVESAKIKHNDVKVLGMGSRTDKHFLEHFEKHTPEVILFDGELHRNSIAAIVEKIRSTTNGTKHHPQIFAFGKKIQPEIPNIEMVKDFSRVAEIISNSIVPNQKKTASPQ